ncbi:ATP-binding cassette domain-containing protein [Sinorhizobium numidicum]|uniref:ATP-binding cassette domain-containing protein n=1 Tax=Sinorhizobium numidicum TaxID=680248 RepID=A0ABY8CTY3_9HYPH|nr:ATP-binding cassette domain-containing protein [Sinorhizobium numidicum]WEX75362.1 ATP-binding cassette domain-containing protein [Sinorhizobium numidicum]WEX81357.1 ATP-binding cassette domain-containing protein [Sinorhizobium numidicum]
MKPTAAPALLVDDVHKSYGIHEVLKGISLSAQKGDVISIIGSSGSGKSTFLRCINFLEIPDRGRFVINGEEVLMKARGDGRAHPANWRQIERLRTGLGMVFQSFNLWAHMTVLENVIEAPVHVLRIGRSEAIEKAESLLAKVGLYEKRHAFPAFLSGGQQQRASIARALCVDPAVMLFDEPTSALDPELVGEVLKVIRDLADEGRTMLLVTHEMKFARDVSSHVMFLHQGRVEEEGPPAQIFGAPTSGRCREFTGVLSN